MSSRQSSFFAQSSSRSDNATYPVARREWRVIFVLLFLVLVVIVVAARLIQYQLFDWSTFDTAKTLGATGSSPALAARGVIVDRGGVLLAADRFLYQVVAVPNRIPPERWFTLATTLEQIAHIPAVDSLTILSANADKSYAKLADDLSLEAGRRLRVTQESEAEQVADPSLRILNQITILATPRRFFPQGDLASQMLGFVNMDRIGSYGLEGYYDRFLRSDGVGLPRGQWDSVEALSQNVRQFVPSATGKDLVLTLDRTMQWIVEEELREGVAFYKAANGTIIVMEPRSGAVLAMASTPAYDPNAYSNYALDLLRDPAISAQYEPGSIFKIITMSAALDTGTITPSTILTDTGTIAIGGRIIRNSGRNAAGAVSATEALALSLNVVTAQIAVMTGAEQFYKYLKLFGFGRSTQIDLFGEVDGLIKSPGNPDWSLSDLGTNSFGQGLAVTPLQMVNAVAAIANGGRLMRPYVVSARVEGVKALLTRPTVIRRVMSEQSATLMRKMMIDTVIIGNQKALVPGYLVGGKSGTAQIPTEQGYTEDDTIVSFVGFAPADDPQFVVLVKLDRPDSAISPWASSTAAPMFSRVTRRLLDYLNIPPDEVRLGRKP